MLKPHHLYACDYHAALKHDNRLSVMLSNIIVIMLTNYMTLLQHLNIDFLFLVSHSATVPILAHLHF